MDAGVLCNKEMVDLLMKIKRHLKSSHNIVISMSDKDLMIKLLDLARLDDSMLQGMLQYFMVLAGGDWNKRYARQAGTTSKTTPLQDFASKVKESVLNHESAQAAPASAGNNARVRYYRGQPVYG